MTVPGSSLASGGETGVVAVVEPVVSSRTAGGSSCFSSSQTRALTGGCRLSISPLSSLLSWASPSPPPPPASSLLLHQSRSDWKYLVNHDPCCHIIVIARGLSRNSCFYISHRLSEGRKESYTQKNSLNPSRRE